MVAHVHLGTYPKKAYVKIDSKRYAFTNEFSAHTHTRARVLTQNMSHERAGEQTSFAMRNIR